jgi:hypothetical protein
MEPLNRKESFELIRELFGAAETITIAAPFFGDGALAQLGLEKSAAKLTVICDLFSGGCNPHEIKKFLNPETDLRTHDRLHAKIYLTDKGVVIGSANPSAKKSDPEYFKDKRISFWLWPYKEATRSAEKEYEKQKDNRRDDDLDFYELTEGELPPGPGTTIVSFYYKPNTASVEFDRITKVLERKHIVEANNGSIVLLVYNIPNVEGTKFPPHEIREFIRMIKQENDFSKKSYPEWVKSGYEMAQEVQRLLQD